MDKHSALNLARACAELSAGHVKFDLQSELTPKQWEVNAQLGTRNCLETSGRAGKTAFIARRLVCRASELERRNLFYLSKSRVLAKRLIWQDLLELERKHNLGGKPSAMDLSMSFPKGTTLYILGADAQPDIEKVRGTAWTEGWIDEFQMFPEFGRDLIQNGIIPRLADYNGILGVSGTPGPLPKGVFHDICTQKEGFKSFKKFHFTLHDNPWIPIKSGKTVEQIIQEECESRGVPITDPSIQREYFGLWVEDKNALVYHALTERNLVKQLPEVPFQWLYIIGIDLGFNDSDALSVVAYHPSHPKCYLAKDYKANKLDISSLCQKIGEFYFQYKPVHMVIDTGGLGKKIAEEIRQRFGFHVEPAEKKDKYSAIALLNSDFNRSNVCLVEGSNFYNQALALPWNRNVNPPKEDDRYDNDSCDAFIYAYRKARHFLYKEPGKDPTIYEEKNKKREEYARRLQEQARDRNWYQGLVS